MSDILTHHTGLSASGSASTSARGGAFRARLSSARLRIIPQVDKNLRLVTAAQSLHGRVILFVIVTALAVLLGTLDVDLTAGPIALLCGYFPRWRAYLVSLATLLFLCNHGFFIDVALISRVASQEGLAGQIDLRVVLIGTLPAVVSFCALVLAIWPRMTSRRRHPTSLLVAGFVALVALAQSPIAVGMPRVVLWALLVTFLPYLWFMAYVLASANSLERFAMWRHLGVFHPFWGSTLTPFGKGVAYLERYEAKRPDDLAVTQLSGLKLALWTLALAAIAKAFAYAVYVHFNMPSFDSAFLGYVAGKPVSRSLCWTSIVTFFVTDMLYMTVWGGAIISCARLAGFRLLRNTYKPLQALTIAEFWNRYYFYYKELLVDHFFFPTFLSCFRRQRRLRMFFATFMAACVGNLLFHFLRDIHFVVEMGWRSALIGEASHAFYTFLLAIGVGISQMRTKRPRSADFLRGRLLPFVWVALFFCVLHVFDAPLDRTHSIGQRIAFLTYLFGVEPWN